MPFRSHKLARWRRKFERDFATWLALGKKLDSLGWRMLNLQDRIDDYGDEWSKDDWPHAVGAGVHGRDAT